MTKLRKELDKLVNAVVEEVLRKNYSEALKKITFVLGYITDEPELYKMRGHILMELGENIIEYAQQAVADFSVAYSLALKDDSFHPLVKSYKEDFEWARIWYQEREQKWRQNHMWGKVNRNILPGDLERLVEAAAEKVHNEWMRARLAEGWSYGRERNDQLKMHPGMVSYEKLSETEKEYDRNTVVTTLKFVIDSGFKIEKIK